ncbi:MAG TPA: hypothetical protein VEA41_23335 [Salinarimonas sp.]|nr:hypothetical protein [Salinarimonas sp.]
MAEIIDWPLKPFNPKEPQDYDNLGPMSPELGQAMYAMAKALNLMGADPQWDHCLCAHCKRAGIQKCGESDCDMFDGC